MNIKITRAEHNRLLGQSFHQIVMGSKLYGTNSPESDTDVLCVYEPFGNWKLLEELPNFHQFQYVDEVDKIDYIYCTFGQFWKNQRSGDSTINSDVIIFSDEIISNKEEKLNYCRTQKVIKGYIGFANRDIKDFSRTKSPKKQFHILRGLYTAECLLKGELPSVETIREFKGLSEIKISEIQTRQSELRALCNAQYERGDLENYYIKEGSDTLLNRLLKSNNTREFRYD